MLCKLRNQLAYKIYDQPIWAWGLLIILLIIIGYLYMTDTSSYINDSDLSNVAIPDKFTDVSQTKVTVFNFNTSWCGWSKKFQPEWDKFVQVITNDDKLSAKIDVKEVKCDIDEDLCAEYDVTGYPYVLIIKNDTKLPYNGKRTSDALLSHVSSL
jgi:thiol-disulfide isomerase/thioredoxin